jgi:glycosyltransferase involved in cell wall biosynthesis
MRLLVISHTPHHRRDGDVLGWAPTIREIDQLATRFSSVRHLAPLHDGDAPASSVGYQAKNVELVAVRPAGAEGASGKLDALRKSPQYVRAIARELDEADVVHVRAPANIALIAMLVLAARKRPAARWFKYAGNWQPNGNEARSYRLQRWLLTRKRPGLVTVNGHWPAQPAWVRAFENPCLDEDDLARGAAVAESKQLSVPLRIVFVGQLASFKGVQRAIAVMAKLETPATLELIGDGPERPQFEQLARELGIVDRVVFRGWQPPAEVRAAFARAHIQLLPTASEGWPKVLAEGMAYGVVPVTSAVSSIPQYIERFGCGVALAPDDIDGFVHAIDRYAAEPARWKSESKRAVENAAQFSFRHYLAAVDQLLLDLDADARR